MILIGVDTGGTFTDFIYKTANGWGVHKRLSTPHDPSEAVIGGVRHILELDVADDELALVHGSTVATNAILERKGATTALVTNQGFTDVVEIARQNRSRLYDLSYRKNPPLVPAERRFGIPGRMAPDVGASAEGNGGVEVEPFDENAAADVARRVAESGAESVAVCLLFSYLDPEHERRMAELLAPLGLPISLSHEVLAEFREYERASTTLVNAYVSPKMTRYLQRIQAEVGDNPFRIMQSNGGSISARTAGDQAVRTILSGPAGGAVGALEIGRRAGLPQLITFDMGGTSTDVALLDGRLPMTTESSIAGFPVRVPMIGIHTVGAGGGSIARIDAGGALTVGPESAGADPGPICYGKGEEITVTDANLFLGRLIPERFLGGAMSLAADKLHEPFERMAARAGLTPEELAEGVLDVANATMERAIRVISVERGFDPREFTLLSFGGAGGMHCAYLARLLSMPRVLVPRNPGILSAMGMLMADVVKDYSLTVMLQAADTTPAALENMFEPLRKQALADLGREGFSRAGVRFEPALDMRYQGQSFELTIPFGHDYAEAFHAEHERAYGSRHAATPLEIVTLRLTARAAPDKPAFPEVEAGGETVPEDARLGAVHAVFEGQTVDTRVYERDKLKPGNVFHGPAICVEYSSTIVVPPFATARVDALGNLILDVAVGG